MNKNKHTDTKGKENICSTRQTGVKPLPEVEDGCVIGERILCDEGSGDERIRQLKEWEKGW
jgi:hypothetical protein